MTDSSVPNREVSVAVESDQPAPQYIVTIAPAVEGSRDLAGEVIPTVKYQCATLVAAMIKHDKVLPDEHQSQALLYAHGTTTTRLAALAAMCAAEVLRTRDELPPIEALKRIVEHTLSIVVQHAGIPLDPKLS